MITVECRETRSDSSCTTVSFLYSVGCMNREHSDYITLELDEKQEYKLHFVVDSGAYIRLVKSYKLLGTDEFEPKDGTHKVHRTIHNRDPWQHRDLDTGRSDRYLLAFRS